MRGTPRVVRITLQAFQNILLSAIEVFKKECLGYLVGYRGEEWIVWNAAPYQTAERSFVTTEVQLQKVECVARFAELFLPGLEVIGDYHSHAQWGTRLRRPLPSEMDRVDARPNMLSLIVAVNELPERAEEARWRVERAHRVLRGELGKYHFELAGYYSPNYGVMCKVPLTLEPENLVELA